MTSYPGLFKGPGVFFSALLAGSAMAENPAEVVEMGRVDVIAITPLPSLGMPLSKVPANAAAEQSLGSGAPRGAWMGLGYEWP